MSSIEGATAGLIPLRLPFLSLSLSIYIYVCVCVCVYLMLNLNTLPIGQEVSAESPNI